MRLKTYWHIISKSFTSPEYYLEVLAAPFWFSLRFFIISLLFLGLALSWKINQQDLPVFQAEIFSALDEAEINYPQDLEIIWSENQLQSTATEVLKISYPSSADIGQELPPILGYFVPENIENDQLSTKFGSESFFVIGQNNFFINDLQGTWTGAALTDILPESEIVLNKETASALAIKSKEEIGKIIELIKKVDYVVIPLFLIMIKFWVGLMEGLLVFLFFKLNKFKINFSKTLQLSLHLVVISEVINQVSVWIYPNIQFSMFTLAYWAIFSYIFWTQKNKLISLN